MSVFQLFTLSTVLALHVLILQFKYFLSLFKGKKKKTILLFHRYQVKE